MNEIYKLGLHGSCWDKNTCKNICRVPGGWIYEDYDTEKDVIVAGSGVFVPFDREFQTLEEIEKSWDL